MPAGRPKTEARKIMEAEAKRLGGKCGICHEKAGPDQYCFGCKNLICDHHTGDTNFGGHSVGAHISPDEFEDAE